jgi:hypothetical protein
MDEDPGSHRLGGESRRQKENGNRAIAYFLAVFLTSLIRLPKTVRGTVRNVSVS